MLFLGYKNVPWCHQRVVRYDAKEEIMGCLKENTIFIPFRGYLLAHAFFIMVSNKTNDPG